MMVDGLRFKERLWLWVLTFVRTTRRLFVVGRIGDRPCFLTFDEKPLSPFMKVVYSSRKTDIGQGRFTICAMMQYCR
jgi:hypothetical protein